MAKKDIKSKSTAHSPVKPVKYRIDPEIAELIFAKTTDQANNDRWSEMSGNYSNMTRLFLKRANQLRQESGEAAAKAFLEAHAIWSTAISYQDELDKKLSD